jgi:hypothetical protein
MVAHNWHKRMGAILRVTIQIFKVMILNNANESATVHLYGNVTVYR